MASIDLYRRIFNRTQDPDADVVADDTFRKANFKDFFGGTWLNDPNNVKKLTFHDLLTDFWSYSINQSPRNSFGIFGVADGGGIKATDQNAKWLNQHIRFVAFASGGRNGPEDPFQDNDEKSWTLCIVGSQDLKSETRFLQVVSWDTRVFRYYERGLIQLAGVSDDDQKPGWVYQGVSTEAFSEESYLGPFNGHVNGGLIMKEIHKPWLHWMTDANDPTPNFPKATREALSKQNAPYLSDVDPLSKVISAEQMERYITDGVGSWFTSRWKMDFLDDKKEPLQKVKGLKRWIAHILLTTSVNIQTALPFGDKYLMPPNHVINFELLSMGGSEQIWPSVQPNSFPFSKNLYDNAVKKDPQLALITNVDKDEVPSGYTPAEIGNTMLAQEDPKNPRTEPILVIQVEAGEGDQGTFTILHPSIEDAKGARLLMTDIQKKFTLLSEKTYNAMIMVDPWNPLYSWKRGVLLQYVPNEATFDSATKSYDMEKNFIAAVNASPRMKDVTSPEYEFIQNLSKKPEDFSEMLTNYIKKVKSRLTKSDGISDYLKLAESRRRVYRPVPLDEFAFTLPWAWVWDHTKPLEMKPDGTIQEISDRGKKFFDTWIGTLRTSNPVILPRPDANDQDDTAALSQLQSLDSASKKSLSPSVALRAGSGSRGGCPFQARSYKPAGLKATSDLSSTPTWDDDILAFFTAPYWIDDQARRKVAARWVGAMQTYGSKIPPDSQSGTNLTLNNYEHVKYQAVTIYQHCASRSMPITRDPKEYWPDDALEIFRTWVNQGCRKSKGDTITIRNVIQAPSSGPQITLRTRKDIRDLNDEEIQIYRAKIHDILQVHSLNSKWQELGQLHAWWCLHYQEATFLWHRCWLKYVETLIDFPIPYWNGFALDASDPSSDFAGLPKVFLDETFTHPDGTIQPNPLRYALSYNGVSRDGTSKFIKRDLILEAGRPPHPGKALDDWNAKIGLLKTYHTQIVNAMKVDSFSGAQGNGVPWAVVPTFMELNPDSYYQGQHSFDGWFEQTHDNFHGWIGGENGDMADNTYTAFDPIFLNYHCNMDRLFEHYLRSNPTAVFTSNFPLRPFIHGAMGVDYNDPNTYSYTTIGDMAKNTVCNGYIYAPPASPDVWLPAKKTISPNATSGGGIPFSLKEVTGSTQISENLMKRSAASEKKPYILFQNVACTERSYEIDLFLRNVKSEIPDHAKNPGYIGRLFRFGMGIPPPISSSPEGSRGAENIKLGQLNAGNSMNRCQKRTVTRVVEVGDICKGEIKDVGFKQMVRELKMADKEGRVVPETEWSKWKGFVGELIWIAT